MDTTIFSKKKFFCPPKHKTPSKVAHNPTRPRVFSPTSFCFVQLRQFFNLTFSHLWSYQTLQDENSLQIALKRYLIPNHLSVYIWIETKLLLCELAFFLFHFQMIQRNWARIYMIVLQKIRVIKIMPSLKVIITYLAHYISMYVAWKNDWQSEFDVFVGSIENMAKSWTDSNSLTKTQS